MTSSDPIRLLLIFAIIIAINAFSPSYIRSTIRTAPSTRLFLSSESEPQIQFVKGLPEKSIPSIKVTRAVDGSSGTATFKFDNPNVFDASTADRASGGGDVTGMFLVDEEGEMSTTNVNAKFLNGKPQSIESVLIMRSPAEWDRFMRFMERYGDANGLGFTKAG